MKQKIVLGLFSLLLVPALLAGCSAAPETPDPAAADTAPLIAVEDDIVTASAEVVADRYANLSFMLGGPQVDIFVKPGDQVKKGEVLASFPENALPQAIVNAQADLLLAQDSLDDLLNADTALAQAVITLRSVQDDYDEALEYRESLNEEITIREVTTKIEKTPFGKIEVPKVKEYKGFAGKEDIAKADEDLALKTAMLEDAQRELARLTNPEQSAEVQAAMKRVEAIQSVIDQAKLVAPFDGTVVDVYANSGEMVSPGVPLILLADLSTLQVRTTDLNEVDVARVKNGDPVKITFDALPDTTVTGTVDEISLKNTTGSGVYYDIFIKLDQIPEILRWGMSAFAEIQTARE